MAQSQYTTELSKGQGMVEETLALLSVWQPGMTQQELTSAVVEGNVLRRATALRARDMVVRQFAPRYLVDDAKPARQIKILLDSGLSPARLKQVFLIHTARANLILHEFITDAYWPKYETAQRQLSKQDALQFLDNAVNLGRIPQRWSPEMTDRVARYLGGCLADFGLLEPARKSTRRMLDFSISPVTSLYLAHDIHFSGYNDDGIIQHPDWRLFGLEPVDAVRQLERVASGHFIPQFSGDLLRVSWKYNSMEEALRAIVAAEL